MEQDKAKEVAARIEEAFFTRIRAGQPVLEEAITEVSGWKNVANLAAFVVDLIITNCGGDAESSVRPPCWQDHAPPTMAEMTDLLCQNGRKPSDPAVAAALEEYKQSIIKRFGL